MGDYTILLVMAITYITDSNNARTFQRNFKNGAQFTHHQLICNVKQGIDHSIANHLEFLTSKWLPEETPSAHILDMYKKSEQIC
jgi:hypothetical protein